MNPPLIRLEGLDVVLEGHKVLRDIHWQLHSGEHWAVLGGNGSGKSTLLKLLRGELPPAPGSSGRRVYAFDGDEQFTAVGIKEKIALVSPELQNRYLQQDWRLTGREVIHSGFLGGDYVYQRPTDLQLRLARDIVKLLCIVHLLSRNVQELSTGELRKLLIGRALAGAPRILICDEVCDGLDAPSRMSLLQSLDRAARRGTQLVYTTHRADELLPIIRHRLVLERGRIVEPDGHARTPISANGKARGLPAAKTRRKAAARATSTSNSPTLIHIERATVYLGGRRVLDDISLEIKGGQHWAILGGNGSGKTTLLKLIIGDLHPALGGRIQRFAFTRRNTLWQLRKKIGYVSPELQALYREPLTGAEVIASGLFSSIGLMRPISRRNRAQVTRCIDALGLGKLAEKTVLRMSYGEARRILLARALVHQPRLLVCDEPFDGLDAGARARMSRSLELAARTGTTLVVVTHHPEDLPANTTHIAELRSGKMIFCGRADEYGLASSARIRAERAASDNRRCGLPR
jgi:molybdate transport system ATP-binding protein